MKVNGYRADDLARVGLITRERWVMPLWMSVLGVVFRALGRFLVWPGGWRIPLRSGGLWVRGYSVSGG